MILNVKISGIQFIIEDSFSLKKSWILQETFIIIRYWGREANDSGLELARPTREFLVVLPITSFRFWENSS